MYHRIIFVTGPSGSGKTHLYNQLINRNIAEEHEQRYAPLLAYQSTIGE